MIKSKNIQIAFRYKWSQTDFIFSIRHITHPNKQFNFQEVHFWDS